MDLKPAKCNLKHKLEALECDSELTESAQRAPDSTVIAAATPLACLSLSDVEQLPLS